MREAPEFGASNVYGGGGFSSGFSFSGGGFGNPFGAGPEESDFAGMKSSPFFIHYEPGADGLEVYFDARTDVKVFMLNIQSIDNNTNFNLVEPALYWIFGKKDKLKFGVDMVIRPIFFQEE